MHVLLEGQVTVSVVVDTDSGELLRCWVDRDQVTWLAPSWVLPTYRRALIGTHYAARKHITDAAAWPPINERPPEEDT